VLAQFDDDSVVVYQAYRPSIGHFAAAHGNFLGGGFSLQRMSWIKPGFLWMMNRCGWASKAGQEVVLAVWIMRALFDAILAIAVPSTWNRDRYPSRDAWQAAVKASNVRLQWDPDHTHQATRSSAARSSSDCAATCSKPTRSRCGSRTSPTSFASSARVTPRAATMPC
jgi:hypothetical protein